MMNQVLRRRFARQRRRAGDYDESFATLPDLVVVDGGKGQLSAAPARAARGRRRGRPSSAWPSSARRSSCPGAAIRCRCRPTIPARCCCSASATRRTASRVTYHRQRRDADLRKASVFDELPQVGPVRRRRILEHFGSPERFIAASREELERVPGLPAQGGEGDLCASPQGRLSATRALGPVAEETYVMRRSASAACSLAGDLPLEVGAARDRRGRGARPGPAPSSRWARAARALLRRRARDLRPRRRRLRRRARPHRLRARRVRGARARARTARVVSYRDLAARGRAARNAYRAVGSAMARNALPVILPCHRVVRNDGRLGQLRRRPGLEGAPARRSRASRVAEGRLA